MREALQKRGNYQKYTKYHTVKNFGGKKFGEIVFLKHWQKTLANPSMTALNTINYIQNFTEY